MCFEQFITLCVHRTKKMREHYKSKLNINQGILIRHVVLEHEGAKCRQNVEIRSIVLGKTVLKLGTSAVQCVPYSTWRAKECNRKGNIKKLYPDLTWEEHDGTYSMSLDMTDKKHAGNTNVSHTGEGCIHSSRAKGELSATVSMPRRAKALKRVTGLKNHRKMRK